MTEPTRGTYEIEEVDGYEALSAWLTEFEAAPSVEDKAAILAELLMNGHKGTSGYLTFGNNKVAKNTGIFNMNSATDCPNADSDEDNPTDTGVCQVSWQSCYAHKAENIYPDTLKKRRLQEYLWDNIRPTVFAKALLRVKSRKRSSFDYLRVSESGDFRHEEDIKKVDIIAEIVSPDIEVYTYSASHKLDWSHASNYKVMQSNDLADYGNAQFSAVENEDNIPEDAIFCPYEAGKKNGLSADERVKCGECTKCIDMTEERDVYITIH